MKPYYESHGITIFHGDCHEIAPTIPEEIGAVISDPPYGIGHFKGPSGAAVKGRKSLRRNTHALHGDDRPFDPSPWLAYPNVILWGANHYAQRLPPGRWLVWDKLDGVRSFDSFSDVEIAWHKKTGANRIFHYLWKGVCQAGEKGERRSHPTQKPIALMEWCIEQAGEVKPVILDPFCGSGSTLIAARKKSLRAVGIEIEERYCEAAAIRLERFEARIVDSPRD